MVSKCWLNTAAFSVMLRSFSERERNDMLSSFLWLA
jgi:hypothetical protein